MYKQEALDSLECFRSNTAHILGDNDEKVKTIETCMMLVQEAEETERWIPVSEKPKTAGYYNCTCYDGVTHRVTTLKWSNSWMLSGQRAYWKVLAWMPLPEPYKEIKDDNNRKS